MNDPGTFGGDVSGTGTEDGGAITGTLTFTDAGDGASAPNFRIESTDGPANGTAGIDASGNWTYTPNVDFNGTDSFTVSVTDDDGNVETHVISITVLSPSEQADLLIGRINDLELAGTLNRGNSNSLRKSLRIKENNGDIGRIRAFIEKVEAFRNRGKLSDEVATQLLADAARLLTSLTISES